MFLLGRILKLRIQNRYGLAAWHMNCHELSLLFKDWVQRVTAVKDLYRRLKNITIWIRNHGNISMQFEGKLRAQFSDKRKWTIKPYMPGDTRMGRLDACMAFEFFVEAPQMRNICGRTEPTPLTFFRNS